MLEKIRKQRVIHTTADFEYADLIEFLEDPISSAKEVLSGGCKIYCDTNMIVNGLSKNILKKFNCIPYTLVSDAEVSKEAKARGVTRSIVGMEHAGKDKETKIFLIGNAPTALYKLKEMIEKNEIEKPALVVGVPVGFVGAAESKEIFKNIKVPYITINGRKGGSTVAKNEIEKPALVVGVPVGFVGAAESKEIFKNIKVPYITINGRKGGSTVAVSILHGILYQIYKREGF